jgi:biotin carboxylase
MKRVAMIETNMSGTGFQAFSIAPELGIELVFVTRDLGLYQAIPGITDLFRRYISEFVTCETNDEDSTVKALEDYRSEHPLDGIAAFGEYHVSVAAAVCRRLGLPGPDPASVRISRNKDQMRAVCAAAGVPVPRFAVADNLPDAAAAADSVGYPCVVKPADQSGSTDVAICFDAAQARRRTEVIQSTPVNYRGQRRSPVVLFEEYLTGHEVSVETVTSGGRTTVIGVTDKQLSSLPYFVEMGHAFPSALPADVVSACAGVAVQALAAVGYDLGVAHVEVRMADDGPRLIEINPRPAGDRIPDLVELATGISLVREVLRMSLGEAPDLTVQRSAAAAIRFGWAYPGRVRQILGADFARGLPGVADVGLEVAPGGLVRPLTGDHDRVSYVIADGKTTYEACRTAETGLAHIMVDTVPEGPEPEDTEPEDTEPEDTEEEAHAGSHGH